MQKLFGGVYKNKKVFITGHTGFKGSWLSLWLTKLGAQITGYAVDIPTKPNHFNLLNLDIETIMADVLDKQKLALSIKKCKPDIVFHLAAQPIVRRSYEEPIETLETNIMGTANVLESCRMAGGVKAIVIITTDKCYQDTGVKRGYKESDRLGGSDPYSASKACAELIVSSYRNSFFNLDKFGKEHETLLASARAGNVIGGGDWAKDRLIPDLVRAASQHKLTLIRFPNAVRPWQYVLEPLRGYLQLGEKMLLGKKEFADCWNFGPKNASGLAVKDVLKIAKDSWGDVEYKIQTDKTNPHEANFLVLNSSKAKLLLKWQGVWESKTAIKKTILWYKSYYEEGKVVSGESLDEYQKALGY